MKSLFNFFRHNNQLVESNEIVDSTSNRLFIPLKVYPYALKYRGKLLTKTELDICEEEIKYLLKENFITEIPSIKKIGETYNCSRCENNQLNLFAEIECKLCFKTHLYCRACIQMNRVLECEPLYFWHDQSIIFTEVRQVNYWKGELTKAQKQGAAQSIKALNNQTDKLIWAVTGSGKTELVFPVITKALDQGMRVCVASPRTDVVKEFRQRINPVFKSTSIAALYAGSEEAHDNAQLIVTTNHQLLRFKHTFDLLIIDEVDAYPYISDDRLKKITQRSRKKIGTTIYLTATPDKNLQKLPTVFIPVRYHGNPLIIPQIIYNYQLSKNLSENKLPKHFNQILNTRKESKRQLLIFVPTIKLSIDLKESITRMLLNNDFIQTTSEVKTVNASDEDRGEKVKLFREKKIYCLITTTILERGVTFPSIDVIVINADNPIFNSAALVQIAGRAGRSSDDPKGDVYFLINNNTRSIKQCLKDLKFMNILAKEVKL